jgi:hypothetical protein
MSKHACAELILLSVEEMRSHSTASPPSHPAPAFTVLSAFSCSSLTSAPQSQSHVINSLAHNCALNCTHNQVSAVHSTRFQSDALIVAGDVANDIAHVERTLQTLKAKFSQVVFMTAPLRAARVLSHLHVVVRNGIQSHCISFFLCLLTALNRNARETLSTWPQYTVNVAPHGIVDAITR